MLVNADVCNDPSLHLVLATLNTVFTLSVVADIGSKWSQDYSVQVNGLIDEGENFRCTYVLSYSLKCLLCGAANHSGISDVTSTIHTDDFILNH